MSILKGLNSGKKNSWLGLLQKNLFSTSRDATFHGASNPLLFSHLVLVLSLFTFFTPCGRKCLKTNMTTKYLVTQNVQNDYSFT